MGLFSKVLDVVYHAEKAREARRLAKGGKDGLADVPTPLVPHDPFAPKAAAKPNQVADESRAEAKARQEKEREDAKPIADPAVPAQLFGRESDPWTGRVKLLLRDRQVDFSYVDLDQDEHVSLGARLVGETRQTESPYVYLRGEFIGGYNALSELDRLGQLEDRVLPADQRQKAVGGVRIVVPQRGPEGGPPAGS
jgi:glutaredoxin